MKIGINLLPLRPGKNGGMEIYVRNLLASLLKIDNENEYFLITAPYNDSSLDFPESNCKKILLQNEIIFKKNLFKKIVEKFFRNENEGNTTLEQIIEKYEFDLWFCPFLSLDPKNIEIPSLVTIPDIQHEYYPENFSDDELSLRKGYIQPSCEIATIIITISEFSKKTILEKIGIDSEKIHVIYLAAADSFSEDIKNSKDIIEKYHLPKKYFFYPANGWPHKNHQMLIEAFQIYKKSDDEDMYLVLTGSDVKQNSSIQNLISQYNLKDWIRILEYINFEDLPGIYKNAKSLVFPSNFEGFGIPLLEGMATGCPIIASNTTSIPEIAGDSAFFFDPKDPQSIADAMHRIVHDNILRERIIQNGKTRIKQFSYIRVARNHLDLFTLALKTQKRKFDSTVL